MADALRGPNMASAGLVVVGLLMAFFGLGVERQ
jgi:hypothetical protein